MNELIQKSREGDQLALQQLLCSHFDRLHRHIQLRLGRETPDELSTEDILQDTFVHAVRDISRCESTDNAAFLSWLKGIADNRFRDALKRKKTQKRGGNRQRIVAVRTDESSSLKPLVDILCDQGATPSVDAASGEVIKAVQSGLALLPDDQREAMTLRYIVGCDLDEVGKRMNRSPAAVRGLLHRGKQRLRDVLGNSTKWFSKKS